MARTICVLVIPDAMFPPRIYCFYPAISVYYMRFHVAQAIFPHFKRVFLSQAVENGLNTANFPAQALRHGHFRLIPPLSRRFRGIKAEDSIALAKLAPAVKPAKPLSRIEMLVMFGDHYASGSQQVRFGNERNRLLIIAHLSVRRIEKTEVAANGLRAQQPQRRRNIALVQFVSAVNAERFKIIT